MCKSAGEGGQRCAAHTRQKEQKARAALKDAVDAWGRDGSGDIRGAQEAWEKAATEFASTPEGQRTLAAEAHEVLGAGRMEYAANLATICQRGQSMREANAEAATRIRAGKSRSLGGHGEPRLTTPAVAYAGRPDNHMAVTMTLSPEMSNRLATWAGDTSTATPDSPGGMGDYGSHWVCQGCYARGEGEAPPTCPHCNDAEDLTTFDRTEPEAPEAPAGIVITPSVQRAIDRRSEAVLARKDALGLLEGLREEHAQSGRTRRSAALLGAERNYDSAAEFADYTARDLEMAVRGSNPDAAEALIQQASRSLA
jgi:hypothetical protein